MVDNIFKLQLDLNNFHKFVKSCIFVHSQHVLIFSNSYMDKIWYLYPKYTYKQIKVHLLTLSKFRKNTEISVKIFALNVFC